MLGLALVRPLDDDWRETLDRVARRRGWPTSADVGRLAEGVAELSAAYNDPARARAAMRDAGAARLVFAFVRDVPKGGAAVRELIATRRLRLDESSNRPLRVLDLGAGLGASTWGVVRALEAAGMRGVVEADWVDADGEALALGAEVARGRAGEGGVQLRVRTRQSRIDGLDGLGRYDLVIVSQLLSELDVGVSPALRLERHTALVASWLDQRVEDAGSLAIVEPALRDRTRHLHAIRDALAGRAAVTIFAPCLHSQPCPALAREGDWCHEDLPVDVPSWLVPVARAAGLRRQGLTFSYLVLRKDGLALATELGAPTGTARLRVVSGAIPSKGKREAFVCGELGHAEGTGRLVAGRLRLLRLNRDAREANRAWDVVERGDLLFVRPPPGLERPRIDAESSVDIASPDARVAERPEGEGR